MMPLTFYSVFVACCTSLGLSAFSFALYIALFSLINFLDRVGKLRLISSFLAFIAFFLFFAAAPVMLISVIFDILDFSTPVPSQPVPPSNPAVPHKSSKKIGELAFMAVFSFLLVSILFLPAFLPPTGTFNDVELSITLTYSSESNGDLPPANNTSVAGDEEDTVYITESGSRFHRESCPTISNSHVTAAPRNDALAAGYEPCKKCNP